MHRERARDQPCHRGTLSVEGPTPRSVRRVGEVGRAFLNICEYTKASCVGVRDRVAPRMPVPTDPPRDEQPPRAKPRRIDGWVLFAVGALILVGLLGYLLTQQRTSNETPDITAVERAQRESAPVPGTEARPSDATRRSDASTVKPKTAPTRVAYMVTHRH